MRQFPIKKEDKSRKRIKSIEDEEISHTYVFSCENL